MCAKQTMKIFDTARAILSVKFMFLVCIEMTLRSDLFVYKHIQLARAWEIQGLKNAFIHARHAFNARRERGIGRK